MTRLKFFFLGVTAAIVVTGPLLVYSRSVVLDKEEKLDELADLTSQCLDALGDCLDIVSATPTPRSRELKL